MRTAAANQRNSEHDAAECRRNREKNQRDSQKSAFTSEADKQHQNGGADFKPYAVQWRLRHQRRGDRVSSAEGSTQEYFQAVYVHGGYFCGRKQNQIVHRKVEQE